MTNYTKGRYKIIKDPKHGYLRADPLPTYQEIEKYYKEEFYTSKYKAFNDSSLKVQKEEQDFFNSKWEAVYNASKEHFHDLPDLKGLSLFDIGFGFAQTMLYFKERGLNVSGLDPSSECVEYAKSKGIKAFQSGIEDFDSFGPERYDIVTIINALEHLRDPAKTIVDVKNKLLKKGGLLIIDVPNDFNDFQVVANDEYKLNEWWVCPPNHINYFSVTSLCSLVNQCGYKVVLKESSFPLELFLLTGEVYVGNDKLGKICHNKRVLFEHLMKKHGKTEKLKTFYRTLAELDLGRQITVYCTPTTY